MQDVSYVCGCMNVVNIMLCVYCIYNYVIKIKARSLFSTSHLKIHDHCCSQNIKNILLIISKLIPLSKQSMQTSFVLTFSMTLISQLS